MTWIEAASTGNCSQSSPNPTKESTVLRIRDLCVYMKDPLAKIVLGEAHKKWLGGHGWKMLEDYGRFVFFGSKRQIKVVNTCLTSRLLLI